MEMYEKITGGLQLFEQVRQFERNYKTPTLTDYSLLPLIFKLVSDEIPRNYEVRLIYTLITVYLYSPRAFYGGNIARRLRSRIAEQLDVRSPSTISNTFGTAFFRFMQQIIFREEAERVFKKVRDGLSL